MIFTWVAAAATLDGWVTDPSELPVSGAVVAVYDERFQLHSVRTDTNGYFHFLDLHPGRKRLRVIPPRVSQGAETWLGGTLDSCRSEVITLGARATAMVELPAGSELGGWLFQEDRSPAAHVEVVAYPPWEDEFPHARRVAVTAEDGSYLITGLASDPRQEPSREVFLRISGEPEIPRQYHRGAWSEEDANTIIVDPQQVTLVPDFSVRAGVTLRGTVRDADGPVADASVNIYDARVVRAVSEADGSWEASGLQPGTLLVIATAEGRARSSWRSPDGEALTLVSPGVRENVDIFMPFEGVIRGHLPPIEDIETVRIFATHRDFGLSIPAEISASGAVEIRGLPDGLWQLEFFGAHSGYVDGPIRDGNAIVIVEVVEGQTTDLGELPLAHGASIVGVIVAEDTGEPLYGVDVVAESAAGRRSVATTDHEGRYALFGMPQGSFSLRATYRDICENDPSWVTRYWPDQVNPAVEGVVAVRAGEVREWNMRLERDTDQDQMADTWEQENGLDVGRDDSEQDRDGDGFSNLAEYRLGTDPNEASQTCGCEGYASRRAFKNMGSLLFFGARQR